MTAVAQPGRRLAALIAFAVPFGLLSCSDTGQDRVEIPLYASGSDVSSPVMAVGGVPVTILRADLAFGPLYLCAGNTAGDLCETARLQWLDAAVIDTTSDEQVSIGTLEGVSGSVRSWMYDLGISSQLTRSEPYVLPAAEQLGDASFVLEGLVTLGGIDLPFSAAVPIRQSDTTELGVPVIRKGSDVQFVRDVTGTEAGLTLHFDPASWVSRLDFTALIENAACSAGGSAIVCQEQLELTCDEGGEMESSRDCSQLGQVCLAGRGCTEELVLEPESETYRSLSIALLTTGRPSFEWDD